MYTAKNSLQAGNFVHLYSHKEKSQVLIFLVILR